MQVYGRGLIRRLPPMLDGDPRRIRMVYSLLFSLPGTPVLFYGEEIGMGENLGRRRPAGGAYADAVVEREERRVLERARRTGCPGSCPQGAYGPEFVNVIDQERDPDSLLNFIRTLAHHLPRLPRARLGRRWRSSTSRTRPCWPIAAPGTTAPSVRCTTSPPSAVTVPLALSNWARSRAPCCSTCSADGVAPSPSDEGPGIELGLSDGSYGYRWLRVSSWASTSSPRRLPELVDGRRASKLLGPR